MKPSTNLKPNPTKDELVDARLQELRELVASGDTELTGKFLRDPKAAEFVYGVETGRKIRGGFTEEFPELETARLTPKQAMLALQKGKGVRYRRLREHALGHVEDEIQSGMYRGMRVTKKQRRSVSTAANCIAHQSIGSTGPAHFIRRMRSASTQGDR